MQKDKKAPAASVGTLIKKIYKKWISSTMDGFHTILCMLAVVMFILSRMLGITEMEIGSYILFFANLVVYIFYWNQHKLYQFVNISRRHVKGIPAQSVRLRNLMMLLLFFSVFLLLLVALYALPLGAPRAKMFDWLYTAISFLLGKIFGKSESSGKVNGAVTSDPHTGELAMAGTYDRTLLDILEKTAVFAAIMIAAVFVVFMLVYIYRSLKNKMSLNLEDEVIEIRQEEVRERLQKEKAVGLRLFDRGTDAQVRRNYMKLVRAGLKKRDVSKNWTPSEIEEEAGIGSWKDRSVLHTLYEKARYGRETCTKAEAEEVKQMTRRK